MVNSRSISTLPAEDAFRIEHLSGWGRYPVIKSRVFRQEDVEGLSRLVANSSSSGALARGCGRSYGDAALLGSGNTLLTERVDLLLGFDRTSRILRIEAGVTFDDILKTFVPRGFFLPVTPGTKFVTAGGALASDIHGKNHHQDGCLSNFVHSFKLIVAGGEIIDCSLERNSDLFAATTGGMGLTGVVSELEMELLPVETAYIKMTRRATKSLDETVEMLKRCDQSFQYSVAWIDCLASGKSLGRGIVMCGNHAQLRDLPVPYRNNPLRTQQNPGLFVPCNLPSGLLNRLTVSIFNELYYRLQAAAPQESVVHYEPFFYPLDSIASWNRLYGSKGFIQYQLVVPEERGKDALRNVLEVIQTNGSGSFLSVLKRFGQASKLLSFPMQGYTLALDIPVMPSLHEFTERMDQIVLSYGGRVYLAKDACLKAETFKRMYPSFPEWLKIKRSVDPTDVFRSELSQRLRMFEP